MKEELKEFLKKKAFQEMWYGTSTEVWMDIIDEFFDQYQRKHIKLKDIKVKK